MGADTGRKYSGKPLVVVELGNDWLKIAQVESVRGRAAITKLVLKSNSSPGDKAPEVIAAAFKEGKFASRPVVLCLPRQMINLRMLELPSTDPVEIADMVDLQVGKQTPYSRDEIVSDYLVAGNSREGYASIVLAIVQRLVARQRCQILEEAGLEIERVSIGTEGLMSWFSSVAGAAGAATAVLDVDSFYADLTVMSGGVPVFSRSILVGANQLAEDEARWGEKLAKEVQRSLESFHSEVHGAAPARLLLTGAGYHFSNLALQLKELPGLTVERVDSLEVVGALPSLSGEDQAAVRRMSLTAFAGIALHPGRLELNLMPDSVGVRKGLERRVRGMTWFGILVMASLLSFSVFITIKYAMTRARLEQLELRFGATEKTAAWVVRAKDILRVVDSRQQPSFSALVIMAEIHTNTPENVFFENIEFDTEKFKKAGKGQLTLTGSASTRGEISTLVRKLEQSRIFKDAKEEGATVVDKKTGKYAFKVVCSVEAKP